MLNIYDHFECPHCAQLREMKYVAVNLDGAIENRIVCDVCRRPNFEAMSFFRKELDKDLAELTKNAKKLLKKQTGRARRGETNEAQGVSDAPK